MRQEKTRKEDKECIAIVKLLNEEDIAAKKFQTEVNEAQSRIERTIFAARETALVKLQMKAQTDSMVMP